MKKYELTDEALEINYLGDPVTLYRIRALKDFDDVHEGDLGGFVESEENLDQEGSCWIYDDSMSYHDAYVGDNAKIKNNSIVTDHVRILGNAQLIDNVIVRDHATISGNAIIDDSSYIAGYIYITDNVKLSDALIFDRAKISGRAEILNSQIVGDIYIEDDVIVQDSKILGIAVFKKDAIIKKQDDYVVMEMYWNDGRFITWTRSNNKWQNNQFYGSSEELLSTCENEESRKACKRMIKYIEGV